MKFFPIFFAGLAFTQAIEEVLQPLRSILKTASTPAQGAKAVVFGPSETRLFTTEKPLQDDMLQNRNGIHQAFQKLFVSSPDAVDRSIAQAHSNAIKNEVLPFGHGDEGFVPRTPPNSPTRLGRTLLKAQLDSRDFPRSPLSSNFIRV